jgi:hypothetical protein
MSFMVKHIGSARLPRSLSGFILTLAAIVPGIALSLPPGQVWECVVNGQRTFSDVRCGATPSVRRLNPLNIMDATAVHPGMPYDSYPPYDAQYSAPSGDENGQDFVNDAYAGQEVITINERAIRRRASLHGNHGHRRSRKN